MFYLTPAQFRAMNLGVDVANWIDVELAALLTRASSAVNNHCLAPTLPVPHDFRGGTIVGETHTWRVDPYDTSPTRRIFPYHRPVIAFTSMQIYATKDQFVEFDAGELYYELTEGWVEPASANLTSYGLWGAAMFPFIGLSEPHVRLDYSYGRRIPTTERFYYSEAISDTWRGTVGFWSSDAVTVKVNGVDRPSGWAADRTEGTIKFTANVPTAEDAVDVSFVGTLHPDIAMATGLIAAERIGQRNLLAAGFPQGVRSFRVAEVAVERDVVRRSANSPEPLSISPEAADLLEQFVYRPLGFA